MTDVSCISGNAPDDVKRFLSNPSFIFLGNIPGQLVGDKLFGASIINRMTVTEVTITEKAEEPSKKEGRVVCELVVEEDMLNGGGFIHGGCSALLVDICSTMALMAFGLEKTGDPLHTVSQSLNIVYHSPARMGEKLRIVNTTMTIGSRAHSARTEIWNDTHHRLVVSGMHVKMQPSEPKANL
ncbi:hypothetical protein AX17_002455 [Amanita inopinata Kibby_2008]|nr:hypothetical protein AX17_002455 [Amanita inopinata Kibby_2008]